MDLAEKMRILRLKHGWSPSELARMTGIPQPTIWRIENGDIQNPKADTLVALARAFKVPVDYLLQEDYQLSFIDLLKNDEDIRTVIENYSLLSDEDRRALKRFAESLSPAKSGETKQRYVNFAVRARHVKKE